MTIWVFRTCSPVDLSNCLPGLTGQEVNIGVQGNMDISYLPTCLPGLTGPDVSKLYQGIMVNPYLFTCRPVNLSTRVNRSRGKYRSAGHYGYSILIHLSTCQPVYQGLQVKR